MSTIQVVGLGAINIDHIYQVSEILVDGETTIESVTASPGGSAANTIYGLARLGIETGFIGAAGDDEQGRIALESFAAVGVDISHIRTKKGVNTGSTLCLSDKEGRRSLYVSPGANNLLEWQDIDLTYLKESRMVHLSSFVDEKQFAIQIELAQKLPSSVKVSFAPGMLYATRGVEALLPLLRRTKILFTNKEEMERLTGKDFISGTEECFRSGCQTIVVTLGKGITLETGRAFSSYIRHGDEEYKIEIQPQHRKGQVPATISMDSYPETTGAGDAFAAGFLFGFLKGKNLQQCGEIGNKMAHYAMGHSGAREGLPHSSQLISS